MKVNSKNII